MYFLFSPFQGDRGDSGAPGVAGAAGDSVCSIIDQFVYPENVSIYSIVLNQIECMKTLSGSQQVENLLHNCFI